VLDGELDEIVEGLALAHRDELLAREMQSSGNSNGA
jgi:hypothetical protein